MGRASATSAERIDQMSGRRSSRRPYLGDVSAMGGSSATVGIGVIRLRDSRLEATPVIDRSGVKSSPAVALKSIDPSPIDQPGPVPPLRR
jgi:hypothetical protein